jgi:hypothetical protein
MIVRVAALIDYRLDNRATEVRDSAEKIFSFFQKDQAPYGAQDSYPKCVEIYIIEDKVVGA